MAIRAIKIEILSDNNDLEKEYLGGLSLEINVMNMSNEKN